MQAAQAAEQYSSNRTIVGLKPPTFSPSF